jgi:hypothetical protein
LSVQLQDATGTAVTAGTSYTLNLTSSSATGTFHDTAGCGGGTQVTQAVLASGTSSKSFYYKDLTAGSPVTQANETPSAGLTAASQTQTITVAPGTAAKLALTGPAIVAAGTCSAPFSAIAQDASGVETNVGANTTVTLTAGGQAQFFSDAACATPLTTVTITSGTSRSSFYYKNSASGYFRICRYGRGSTGIFTATLDGNPLQICAETDAF